MDFIWNKITEWLREVMVSGILDNLHGLFDQVNTQVGGIAGQVGMTPQTWNSGLGRGSPFRPGKPAAGGCGP